MTNPRTIGSNRQVVEYGTQILDNYGRAMPALTAYRAVVTRVRDNVNDVLPSPVTEYGTTTVSGSKAQRTLSSTWRNKVVPLLDQVDPVFVDLAGGIKLALADQTRTSDYKFATQQVAIASATTQVERIGTEIESAVTAMLAKAQRLALPSRPTPQDATQEARLAGLKSDLQLLTAKLSGGSDEIQSTFIKRLNERLKVALASGDDLAAWLLCSDWPVSILAPSIGFDANSLDYVRAAYPANLAEILGSGSQEIADAISIYQRLNNSQEGLPALIVATGGFLKSVVESISQYTAATQSR